MTESVQIPEARVRTVWRRVIWWLSLSALAGAGAAGGVLLVVSWLAAAGSAWSRPSVFPLLLCLVTLLIGGLWWWHLGRRARRWTWRAAAAEIEERAGLRRGSLEGAIESGIERAGTSEALLRLQRRRLAGRLAAAPDHGLGGRAARAARRLATAAAIAALATLGASTGIWFAARESATQAWGAVLHPIHHLTPAPLPGITITAPQSRIRRGDDLPVVIRAPLRDSVMLAWRSRGDLPRSRWYPADSDKVVGSVPRLDGVTRVWAYAPDGAISDTLRVEPVDPLLLMGVEIDLRFPPHTRRERERLSHTPTSVSVPAGTWATVTGKASLPVAAAALEDERGRRIPFRLTGEREFTASFTVQSGAWGWRVAGAQGEPLEGEPDSLRLLIVPDSAPRVTITYPGRDTVLSTDMIQTLLVEAQDRYGLSRVELVSWRVSAWGEAWPQQVDELPLADAGPRTVLAAILDARGRGFLPGDTLRYFVRAYDNAPNPQIGRSREYVLRLATLDEIRQRAIAEAGDLVRSAEELAERARDQQQAVEALERAADIQPAPGSQRAEPTSGHLEFRETEAARRALRDAEALRERSEEIGESLRQLQETVQRAGLTDSTVLEQLREIESLFERVVTPELREKIEALRQSLTDLEPEQIREAIRQLADASGEFRERVERGLELLRRAALEQEFATLEAIAEELAEAHEALAADVDSVGQGDADSASFDGLERRASRLAERSSALTGQLQDFGDDLGRAGEVEAGQRAAEGERAASEAARADREAAGSLAARRSGAAQASQRAASEMRRAVAALREGRQGMQAGWRREVAGALRRTEAEASELARRQHQLSERMRSGDQEERARQRSDQGALRRAVDQLGEQLDDVSSSSLLPNPRLSEAADQVGEVLDELLDQMTDGTRRGGGNPQLARDAAERLQDLAYELMQAEAAAAAAASGTGLPEALEQLAQLAQQQGAVTDEAGALVPGASDAVLQELQRLAREQLDIARSLQRLERSLGGRGQVLGRLDELAEEAQDLAEQLQRGRINPAVIERQERLFQRLLDAGRTLEQDEFERERRAERPGDVRATDPGELPADLLGGPRFPIPDDQSLRLYPPALRRLILEYFDRLNDRGGSRGR